MSVLVKVIRKIRSVFKEKPTLEPDDFELEHFLLYHGLVGSSPENQRQFKDVRADIKLAIEEKSSTLMAINLKLLPLWWEEKLNSIFDETLNEGTTKEELLEILCPERDGETEINNSIPLFHESWKVRANAAKIISHLNAAEYASELIDSLEATTGDTKLAFCHLVYALAKLDAKESKEAIARYLTDPDPWIAVDACGSYACLTKDAENKKLLEAILSPHLLDDYQAVQVVKYISLYDFINSENESTRVAGYKLVSGIVGALSATFSTDTYLGDDLENISSILINQAKEANSCALAKALLDLKGWMQDKAQFRKVISDIDEIVESDRTQSLPSTVLAKDDQKTKEELYQVYSAIYLIGELHIAKSASLLEDRVDKDYPFLNEVLTSLSKTEITNQTCAKKIIQIVNELVNIDERIEEEPSAQPVLEDANEKCRTYWCALMALGKHSSEETIGFLLKASQDYAADKREQALKSLIESASRLPDSRFKSQIEDQVSKGLIDNSLQVRYAAVKGIAKLGFVSQVPKILELTGAKEVSMTTQAIETLSELAKNGHKQLIEDSVRAKLKAVRNQYHQEKLKTLLGKIENFDNNEA